MQKYLRYAGVLFEIALIVSLLQNIGQARQARTRVTELVEERDELWEERVGLLAELEYVQSPAYLEKVAREELNLAKPGETVVIVPEGQVSEPVNQQEESEEEKPNYLKWWEVLSGE